ncbi:Imidazolonepropionase [Lentibacillus halodurans]|uniref:Imidazolonepropionase n=1 Tax=Lentibacillus halodurans TaxID=237679 RepID=A0A1I1AM60_9BACI|nr:amidohydrolase family protein [Lentibacillus halodurans]SFB38456.1 Imidazolonepropionase [Lentibacillus halodurans]
MNQVITDVNILYGEDLIEKSEHSVLVKDGVIRKVVPRDELPKDIPTSSASGLYMIPGLIDLHVHLMWDGSLNPVETQEKECYEQKIIRAVANCQRYLRHGITTIRDVGSINDISLQVAQGVKRGIIDGPNLIASGKTLTMTGGHDPFWARFLDGTTDALKATREQVYKGARVIKVSATGGVYGRDEGESVLNAELTYEELKTICEVAHQFGLKVASHAIGRDGILNSIKAGVDSIEHGHFLDEELIQMMEDRNIAWVPTLFTYQQNSYASGIPSYAQKKAKEIVEIHEHAFKNYFNRDILIGCGTDAGAPCVVHPSILDELLVMQRIVFNNKEVLKTATSNAGKILGRKIGQIKEGYVADFTLVKQNPLKDLNNVKNVKCVYKNGELVSNHL